MAMHRKQLLWNVTSAAAGAALGAIGSALVGRGSSGGPPSAPLIPPPKVASPPRAAIGSVPTRSVRDPNTKDSFSQAGEDQIVNFFLHYRGLGKVTYLDVGANDPVQLSNTYLFYKMGFRGVLVEPNVALCQKLRAVRPRDTTLNAGIGVTAATEADFYIMNFDGLSTFSREEAEHHVATSAGKVVIKEVVKMPLWNINTVMEEHFSRAPTFLSIDTEGLDLDILKSLDFRRFRPPILCAETLVNGTTRLRSEILEFMASQDYAVRGGSFVNTIFVDSRSL